LPLDFFWHINAHRSCESLAWETPPMRNSVFRERNSSGAYGIQAFQFLSELQPIELWLQGDAEQGIQLSEEVVSFQVCLQ